MNNFHYHQDPLYSTASRILEGVSDVEAIVANFSVGDNTNFGKVLEIGSDSITFKAKDLPKTRIAFKQRKMGSSEFLLTKLVKLKEEIELDEAAKYSVPYIQKLSGGRTNRTSKQFSNLSSAEEFAKDNYSWVQPILSQAETNKILKQAEADMDKMKPVNGQYEKDYKVTISGVPVIVTVYRWKMSAAEKRSNPNVNDDTGLSNDYMYRLTFDKQYQGIHDPNMGKAAQNAKKLGLKYNSNSSMWEETEAPEESLDEAYKPLRKPEDLVAELQSIIDAPDAKLWDVTSVSIRLSHDDIFDRFPKIYPYVKDMWAAIMTPDGARKTKEIAKKAIEAVHKYYPIKEETEASEETLDEAINWLGDYLPTSEKSQFGGYRPTIIDKKTKRVIYQSTVKYNTPNEAKDHAEDYLKQKSKGIKEPKLPRVGTYKEETEASEETLDEAINWLGDYLPTSEKSKFGGYLPMIINKRTKGLMYQSAAKYNTPQEAKDHAEDYLKQKSKGIKDPKVPYVGTYKEETEEEVTEAVDPATKRRKQLDMARVNAGAMSRDDYNKKYKLGKYRPAGSKLSGPGGVYKNLVKEVLDPEDDASVWIDDFVKSDDPRFEGKSKEERIKMALGAWYAAQKKESVEQSAESLEEATMNAAEKKMAQEIHKVFKDGEQVSQAYAMRIRDMRKQLIKKFGNNWRQKAGITEEGAESLEEVVALPSVKKVIDMVDAMSPKEYSNFLHALADNAFGIAVSTKRVKPNGPSNSDAWEDVADGIRDAAKAYDARPVKMSEGVEELEEAAIYPLTKKALNATFELDSDEFEEFLKELTMYFNKTGDKTGYNEYFQVGDHLERAYKIWKGRDPDVGLDYGI